MPKQVVAGLADAIAAREVGHLSPIFSPDVVASCSGLDDIHGRRALMSFWSRIFERWDFVELHLVKIITDETVVIAETYYLAGREAGPPIALNGLGVFEIDAGTIVRWSDHLDLDTLPETEVARLRRFRAARW